MYGFILAAGVMVASGSAWAGGAALEDPVTITLVEEGEGGEAIPAAAQEGRVDAGDPPSSKAHEPSLFEKWWNGEDSIYSNSLYLSVGLSMGSFNNDRLETEGVIPFAKIENGDTLGFRGDLGFMGKHFGILALGGTYFFTGDNAMLHFSGREPLPAKVNGADVRVFQPRVRYALWRFEAAAQAGPVAHIGWAKINDPRLDTIPDSTAKALVESSFFGSVAAEVAGSLRFYPLSFVYLEGAYQHSFTILDMVGGVDGMSGFQINAGLSY